MQETRKLLRDDQWKNWQTTYTRFKRWGESGVWQRIVEAVNGEADLKALMIDEQNSHSLGRVGQYGALAIDRG